jgi:hypothetical protein
MCYLYCALVLKPLHFLNLEGFSFEVFTFFAKFDCDLMNRTSFEILATFNFVSSYRKEQLSIYRHNKETK